MILWEEAPVITVLGVQFYTYGLFCAVGALAYLLSLLVLCRYFNVRKGFIPLLAFLSILFGVLGSRLFFCLLNHPGIPFPYWVNITTGGFSLFGLIAGVFAAAALCAMITGENKRTLLDIVSCSIPLMITAERLGERLFEGFNVSRPLIDSKFPAGTFLSVNYDGTYYLDTRLFSAILAVILFLSLVCFVFSGRGKPGDLWNLFLILCGAGGIVLESLRYDFHLEYSFVYLQQIISAILLVWGIYLSGVKCDKRGRKIRNTAMIILIPVIGICGGIEFALDRLSISHILLYAIMASALAIPVIIGVCLIFSKAKGSEIN